MIRGKELEFSEFKKALPLHYRYLAAVLMEITGKLFVKMCNRGLYYYDAKPWVEGVGAFIDLNPKTTHSLRLWVKVGRRHYTTSVGVCPPPIPAWLKDKAQNKKVNH